MGAYANTVHATANFSRIPVARHINLPCPVAMYILRSSTKQVTSDNTDPSSKGNMVWMFLGTSIMMLSSSSDIAIQDARHWRCYSDVIVSQVRNYDAFVWHHMTSIKQSIYRRRVPTLLQFRVNARWNYCTKGGRSNDTNIDANQSIIWNIPLSTSSHLIKAFCITCYDNISGY